MRGRARGDRRLKTTTDVRPHKWLRAVYDFGYDLAAALYCRGVEQHYGVPCDYFWVAVEKSAPYDVAVYEASPDLLRLGGLKFERALRTLRECEARGEWPGITGSRAQTLDLDFAGRKALDAETHGAAHAFLGGRLMSSQQQIAERNGQPANPVVALKRFLGANKNTIEQSLSRAIPAEKFLQVAMSTIRQDDFLQQASHESVLDCLLKCAELQLYPGSTLGHAYLVPFRNHRANRVEATFILGYKGIVALCHRSPKVLKIEARTVHEGDEFDLTYGVDGGLWHRPKPWGERTPQNCLGAYAIAFLENGETVSEPMGVREILAIRDRSKAAGSGPWKTDPLAMFRKCPVRRLAPWLPLESEHQQAIADDEAREMGFAKEEPREVAVESGADRLNREVERQREEPEVSPDEAKAAADEAERRFEQHGDESPEVVS